MNFKRPILTMMVALNCEAKPWVDFYRLKKVSDRPFLLYSKEDINVEIVITGIGSLAMSTAIGWVAGRDSAVERVWLNLGIAGHLSRKLGEAVRVHSFIDATNLKRYYPPLTVKWRGDSEALMSVNAPTNSYPDAAMVDMEGLAFYRASSMFTPSELVASIKVISDNTDNSVETLNASKISQLMQTHLSEVNAFSDKLIALVAPANARPISLTLNGIRATHSQQQQLDRLLEKATVLELHDVVSELDLSAALKINEILNQLRSLIDMAAPQIGNTPQARNLAKTISKGVPNG